MRLFGKVTGPSFRLLAALLMTAVLGATAPACETYDPPPETELLVPDNGKWLAFTPVVLQFTEPIDPSSLVITLWQRTLDDEGDLLEGSEPLAAGCTVSADSPCAEITMTLNDDGDRLSLDHGTFLDPVHGKQLIVEVHAGLKDLEGRERKVKDWFPFSITPDCAPPDPAVPSTHLDFQLTSGVWGLFADLTDTLAGIYLQMFVDVSIEKETGRIWMAGTVATNAGDPGTTDPTNLAVYDDDKGWTVFMTGTMGQKADGSFCFSTDTTDLKVKVLGLIDVELKDFKLDFGMTPMSSEDGRDELEGFMTASQALMNGSDLGSAAAPVVAYGSLQTEIPGTIPRLCDPEPCKTMKEQGGDCQLADPWEPGPGFACDP